MTVGPRGRCTDTRPDSVSDRPDRDRMLMVDNQLAAPDTARNADHMNRRTEPRNRTLVVDSRQAAAAVQDIARRHRQLGRQGQTRSQER